jgi:hypothetical protein
VIDMVGSANATDVAEQLDGISDVVVELAVRPGADEIAELRQGRD